MRLLAPGQVGTVSFWVCGTFAGAVLYALCTAAGPPVAAVYGLLVLSGVFFFGLLERRVRTRLAASHRLLLSSPP